MTLPGELYFKTLKKKQEELGEGQKEERLTKYGSTRRAVV